MVRMDITQYVETLRGDLDRAARAMGPDTTEVADRLGYALDASVRLALMEALSHAAAEITNELEGRSVEVRLEGREPVFVVTGEGPSALADDRSADARAVPADGDPGGLDAGAEGEETARITLRLPEALKGRAEEQAGSRGQSLNTWIVGAVRAALTTPAPAAGPGAPGRNRASNKRVQGWVR